MHVTDTVEMLMDLAEDLLILQGFGVKKLGLDPHSLAENETLILVEFEEPGLTSDSRREEAVDYILRQTVGPTASVLTCPSPEISPAVLDRVIWLG